METGSDALILDLRPWFRKHHDRLKKEAAEAGQPEPSLAQICREAGVDENRVWRAVEGDPEKYKAHQKLKPATLYALGRYFNDVDGALLLTDDPLPGSISRKIAEDGGSERDLRIVVANWGQVPAHIRGAIAQLVKTSAQTV